MRNIKVFIIIIICVMLGITISSSEMTINRKTLYDAYNGPEYDVHIYEDEIIVVSALDHTPVVDYSSIISYKDDTLTIKDGVHINYLDVAKKTSITSNGEEVYINYITFTGTSDDETISLINLNLNTYNSNDPSNHSRIVGRTSYIFNIDPINIINSTIKYDISESDWVPFLIDTESGDINIKNSNIEGYVGISTTDSLYMENSTLDVYGFSSTEKLNLINSNINTSFINGNEVLIKDSTITSLSLNIDCHMDLDLDSVGDDWLRELTIENSTLNINGNLKSTGNIFVKNNSEVIMTPYYDDYYEEYNYGFNTDKNIEVSDSTLKVTSIYADKLKLDNSYLNVDSTAVTPLASIQANDIDITNSRVISKASQNIPSIIAKNSIILNDEKSTFKDLDKHILNIITIDYDGETYYTVAYSTDYSEYAELDAYKIYTLKVINGTIDDKTELSIKVLIGDDITLPTNLKANSGYEKGSWEQTGDLEYTYTFDKIPENPKTGVASYINGFIITLCLLLILVKNKNEFSVHKSI